MGLESFKNSIKMPEATRPGEPEFKEVHAEGFIQMDEEKIKPTREEICSEFNISKEDLIVRPIKSGHQRKITAFITLAEKDKTNPKIYYAEGNTDHAELLNDIIYKFLGEKIKDRQEFQDKPEEFDKFWETQKGFIDPFANGFKNYTELRIKLERLQKEKAEKGNKSIEELGEIPNWFLSADSSKLS